MKVKVKCLFDFRFCLGIHLFWWHTMCFLHPFLSHQTWNKDNREGRQGRLSAFFFMAGEKKSLSSSCFFRGFYEVRRYSAIWGWWFLAVPGTCGRVRFPLVPTWMYPLVLHSSLKGANFTLFCCSYSVAWLIYSLAEENLNGLHELMYKILSWNPERYFISRVIYLWLLQKKMNRKDYLN